jgi:hypothetical protein
MKIQVEERARRILSYLPNFHKLENDQEEKSYYPLTLKQNEYLIGIYENNASEIIGNTIITNEGLHVFFTEKATFVAYKNITSIETPSNKADEVLLHLRLIDGTTISVPIRGSHKNGKFKDIFEFLRFLDRVIEDKAL